MKEGDLILRFEEEIRLSIKKESNSERDSHRSHKPFLQPIYENNFDEELPYGGLNVIYAPGAFMSVDRVCRKGGKYQKQRRIIYYLDSRPGQIGSTLLLELLRLEDGQEFSKHLFVQRVDEEFFQVEGINISSGEINEALSRMFRKTMSDFFEIKGRTFHRKSFKLTIQEINLPRSSENTYNLLKRDIDTQTNYFIRELNKLV